MYFIGVEVFYKLQIIQLRPGLQGPVCRRHRKTVPECSQKKMERRLETNYLRLQRASVSNK